MDDRKTATAQLRVEEVRKIADEIFNWSPRGSVLEFVEESLRRLHPPKDN
jgi:hypothetical protein